MKSILIRFFFLCTFCLFCASESTRETCPPGFNATGGAGCVFTHIDPGNYFSAQKNCGVYGEGVISVHSADVQVALTEHLRATLPFSTDYWHKRKWRGPYIGLKWFPDEKEWRWIDGQPLGDYAPWKKSEMAIPTKRRFCVTTTYDGTWVPQKCRQMRYAVCHITESESSSYRVIESAHPYENNLKRSRKVAIPGSDCFRVEFDERSATLNHKDKLTVFSGVDIQAVNTFTKRFSRNRFETFEINDTFIRLRFVSDESGNEWGYKMRLYPCAQSIDNPTPSPSAASYVNNVTYAGSDFFSGFQFETFDDPTHGYVDFVNQSVAESNGLILTNSQNQVYIGADYTNVVGDSERGRKAIRLSSKASYDGNNLIVIDLEHMPSTNGYLAPGCSAWPAFWTCGPDWPTHGEIDIIEYTNTDSIITTTLHTDEGCDQSGEDTSTFTGQWGTGSQNNPADNCDVNAWDQWANEGCGIVGDGQPVGANFNNLGAGGVYALEWVQDKHIRAFFFPRDRIPSDLADRRSPDPDSWGLPYARFELGPACPSDHFSEHSIIFDTTFCGDWAGNVFGQMCSYDVSCEDYVKYNPDAFKETYWLINFVDVYTTTTTTTTSSQ